MCKIQSPAASLCLKSFAPLPLAPCMERRVSGKANQAAMTAIVVEDLSIPFPLLPTTTTRAPATTTVGLRLSLTPIVNNTTSGDSSSDVRFRDALHRMSTNSSSSKSSSTDVVQAPENEEQERPTTVVVDSAITDRMAKLMGGTKTTKREGRKNNTSSQKLASSRSSSPVPMPRGVGRTNSGAALCA